MTETRLATCTLCEAMCGLLVTVDDERVERIVGDPDDPHSRGHICPKATALAAETIRALAHDFAAAEHAVAYGRMGMVIIGRRTLRSMNSWLHDSPRMVKGRNRCTAQMHPDDAARRGLGDGDTVAIIGDGGRIELPLEVTDAVMPGVVCVPHGWGHGRRGTRQPVAARQPGASYNDVIDNRRWDPVSGVSQLNGLPITVERAGSAATRAPRPPR